MSPYSSLRLRNTMFGHGALQLHRDNHCTIEPTWVLRRKCWSKSLSCICFWLNLQDQSLASQPLFLYPSSPLFSPPSHPFSLRSQGSQIKVSFLFMWSFFFLFLLSSNRWFLCEDIQEFHYHSPFFFAYLVDSIQAFSVDHIPFFCLNAFLCQNSHPSLSWSFVSLVSSLEFRRYLRWFMMCLYISHQVKDSCSLHAILFSCCFPGVVDSWTSR